MRRMTEQFDVAIVGARVAGSVAASLLGEAGYRVLLIDATTFPSDTISTHFFRGAGLGSILERLGLVDPVLALGSPPLTCQYMFNGTDREPAVEPPQDPGSLGFALSVRRLGLDQLLLDRARATAGVTVREGTTARSLLRDDDGRVAGIVVEGGGDQEAVTARIVVGADGRGSAIARWVEAPVLRREPASRAMYFRYLRGYTGPDGSWNGPEFSFLHDELVYAFPSDDDVTCLAISINLEMFAAFRTAAETMFSQRVLAHRGVGARFAHATPLGRVLGSGPKDGVVRAPSGPGWALVGDSGLNQDPWTGLGMDNAGIHASFLAEAIDAWLSGRSTERDAFEEYGRGRDAHALPGFEFTADLGRDLTRM
jgi:flavin-dependent dehydrogenase